MATLENEFKQAAGFDGRIKMTIAEMIKSIGQGAGRRAQGAERRAQKTEDRRQMTDDRGI
jgi:hypothetical protein